MELRWMADASTPPFPAPKLYAIAGYIGGNTPYTWTLDDWADQIAYSRLPIFTASDREDDAAAAMLDAGTIRNLLNRLRVPAGKTFALDIEDREYTVYLRNLNSELSEWKLMKYGQVSTIMHNPPTSGGTWGAHWTDNIETAIQGIESGEFHALQWANATQLKRPYDLSVISSDVPLWHA